MSLHWAIAFLVLLNWPLGFFAEPMEQATGRPVVSLHKSIGLTVLALSLLRVGWRATHPPPPLPPSVARWQALAARLSHAALYFFIIAVPLSGWLRISSGRYPLTWFGVVDLPKFAIAPSSAAADIAAVGHVLLAWAMLALVLVHAAAALHHHFRLRDGVLLRMLPTRPERMP